MCLNRQLHRVVQQALQRQRSNFIIASWEREIVIGIGADRLNRFSIHDPLDLGGHP